jgi:hypothetical protein
LGIGNPVKKICYALLAFLHLSHVIIGYSDKWHVFPAPERWQDDDNNSETAFIPFSSIASAILNDGILSHPLLRNHHQHHYCRRHSNRSDDELSDNVYNKYYIELELKKERSRVQTQKHQNYQRIFSVAIHRTQRCMCECVFLI